MAKTNNTNPTGPFFVINRETGVKFSVRTRHVGCFRDYWSTKGAARQAMNRAGLTDETHEIVAASDYEPRMVERINIMSGKPFMEDVNTPACCSPASERYWSM